MDEAESTIISKSNTCHQKDHNSLMEKTKIGTVIQDKNQQ